MCPVAASGEEVKDDKSCRVPTLVLIHNGPSRESSSETPGSFGGAWRFDPHRPWVLDANRFTWLLQQSTLNLLKSRPLGTTTRARAQNVTGLDYWAALWCLCIVQEGTLSADLRDGAEQLGHLDYLLSTCLPSFDFSGPKPQAAGKAADGSFQELPWKLVAQVLASSNEVTLISFYGWEYTQNRPQFRMLIHYYSCP